MTLDPERQLPGGRHFEQWARAGPDATGDFLGTRLLIPWVSVRAREVTHTKPVVWLPAPDRGHAVEIALLFRPAGKHWSAGEVSTGQSLLAIWELRDGEQFRAMAYKRALNEEDRVMLAGATARVQADPPHWSSREVQRDDTDSTMLLGGQQPDGGHRIIDLDLEHPPGLAA